MKKRTFILIEVLIAFLLVALCIVPLVKKPLQFYRTEIKDLELIELGRISEWTFTEVKEVLFKGEIPWESIPEKGVLSPKMPLPPKTLSLPGRPAKKIQRSFQLWGKGEKQGLKNETFKNVEIHIFLNQNVYKYRIPIQKVFLG